MARGQIGRAVFLKLNVFAINIAITAHDFTFLRIPDNKLLVATFHGVVLVDVNGFAGATTRKAVGFFPETPDFQHGIWRIKMRNHV